jgi:multiple sugar transport system ATP-binding protein
MIADGEFVTLLGPSGCGKTTLLRILAGLEAQSEGQVLLGDRVVDALPPKERDVAMVFQSYALYPYMTVAENIALPLEMRRMTFAQRLPIAGRFVPGAKEGRAAIARDVTAVAAGLDIEHLLARKPSQLSGGQRQRVALARAMVREPAVFLMDEPLSNLDAKLRVQARAEIADLHRRLGVTFIYVTHDQTEAMTMSDRVAVMMGGRLLQVAPPREIYENPATLEVACFIGTPEINVFSARSRSDRAIEVAGRVWPVCVPTGSGALSSVAVRPEGFTLQRGPVATPFGLAGTVHHTEHLGSESLVHVAVPAHGKPLIARVEPRLASSVRHGEAVTLTSEAGRILAFDADGRRLAVEVTAKGSVAREAAHV